MQNYKLYVILHLVCIKIHCVQRRHILHAYITHACYEQGISFLPIAAETLGGLHRVAVIQLKRLASALARQSGEDEGIATRQLFQRFSLFLMQGNAQMQV